MEHHFPSHRGSLDRLRVALKSKFGRLSICPRNKAMTLHHALATGAIGLPILPPKRLRTFGASRRYVPASWTREFLQTDFGVVDQFAGHRKGIVLEHPNPGDPAGPTVQVSASTHEVNGSWGLRWPVLEGSEGDALKLALCLETRCFFPLFSFAA